MVNKKFPSTSWTLIGRAGALTPEGRAAIALLFSTYWFPVYAFIRRGGASVDDAFDRTQGFFTCLFERNDLAKVDRGRGSKFRSWLLQCVKNYLANERARQRAGKRPPPEMLESLSAEIAEGCYKVEPSHDLTPERLYNRQFTLSLLGRVLEKTRAKYAAAGREPIFDALKGCLSGGSPQEPYEEIAASLGKTVGTVKKAAFDLRAHYKRLLRAEVVDLLDPDAADDDAAVEEEMRQLLATLSDEPS